MPLHRYTASEYTDMILIYGECQQNAAAALRKYREKYGATRTCPGSVSVIQKALKKLRENQPLVQESDVSEDLVESEGEGSLVKEEQLDAPLRKKRGPLQVRNQPITKVKKKSDQPSSRPGKAQILTSVNPTPLVSHQESDDSEDLAEPNDNGWLVNEEQLDTPLRKKGRPPQVCKKATTKVKKKSAGQSSRPIKAQLLTSANPTRESFCRWVLSKESENHDFLFNMMWTGESNFTVNNVQHPSNRYYWGIKPPTEWPELPIPVPLHVWAAIHRNKIIGPIFIDGNLNATKFLNILSGPVTEYIDDLKVDVRKQLWVQLNGLPAHSAPAVRERLTEMFGEQWIGRYGPQQWPAKSADLSPLELFLWEFIKREAYAKKTKDCIEELKKRISAAFDKLKCLVAKSDLLTRERNKVLKRYEISIAGVKKKQK